MKVLHLPTSVAGNSWGLSQGERSLGIQSDVLVTYATKYRYPADRTIFTRFPTNKMEFINHLGILTRELWNILGKYDVYHFNFGSTLIDSPTRKVNLIDLPLYKRFGKVVVTFCGCDVRQKKTVLKNRTFSACHNCILFPCDDETKKQRVAKFDKYADAIFSLNPDIMKFLPERSIFLPYTIAGWNEITPKPYEIHDKITIMHAPTDRSSKGTDIILKTIKNLQSRYNEKFDFELIENTSYHDTLKKIGSSDLLIDQMLFGWYGAVSVESMKYGIPSIAYLHHDDLHYIPPQMALDCENTIIHADPSSLYDVLSQIIEDPVMLNEYSKKSVKYVNKWHDPSVVALRTMEVYK